MSAPTLDRSDRRRAAARTANRTAKTRATAERADRPGTGARRGGSAAGRETARRESARGETARRPSRTRQGQPAAAAGGIPTQRRKARPQAAERAYARRNGRLRVASGLTAAGSGRARFCLLVMTWLIGGLATTLWLSTAAAGDSFRLEAARSRAHDLAVHDARLRAEVATMQSPPALAEAAKSLGMVPSSDVARLVVAADGTVAVVGRPRVVAAPPPPPPPAPPPAAPAAEPPPGEQPAPGPPAPPPAAAQPAGAG